MSARGWKSTQLAGVAAMGLMLVACGNDTKPSGDGAPAGTPTLTPSISGLPSTGPSGVPSKPLPPGTPTPGRPNTASTERPPSKPSKLVPAMLLTGAELAQADPKRGWIATSGSASKPICGRGSTRGDNPIGSLSRNFTTELDASGGQWLTRYSDAKSARAAYDKIIKTIKSCKAAVPAPTHARKLTENRTLPVGDATQILRWYDYPLPSDPGSEDGGFPHAITLKDSVVSVLSFGEMGPGIKPANFERMTHAAAARLG